MAGKTQYIQSEVSVSKLKKGMTILAYTGFSERFRTMDRYTSKFVRHNFRGTNTVVIRNMEKMDILVEEVLTGDTLIKVYNFPPNLKKITLVTDNLRKALKERGMLGFLTRQKVTLASESKRDLKEIIKMVEQSTKDTMQAGRRPSRKQEVQQQATKQTNRLVKKVRESVGLRKEATKTVESAMDNARKGKADIKEIKYYIDNMLKSSSADAMTAIISLKESDHTYSHCVDVGAIFQSTYFDIIKRKGKRSIFQSESDAMLGAFLHDFGKSKIPKEILDSTEPFERNSRGMQILRSHPIYGAELLSAMNMSDGIVNMAYSHHVKQDVEMLSSYPQTSFDDVLFETRLLSIIDVYQAFVGKRKYKKSWSAPATMRYLDALAGVEYDFDVWEEFLQVMGMYPKGSLVELNDGSLGFVMNVPGNGKDLERPLVAVVRNSEGEDLKHHDLVDLQMEKDVSIVKDADSQEIFGDRALETFMSIRVS
ncbi:MAG: HD domain-containing protein [Proteobacteria bacterium]|nr:HD domain-containing protein [Pseudomonadota bacterium]